MFKNFIHEFLLRTTPKDLRTLDIRFEMARLLYNGVLNEGFKKIKLLKESKSYQKAKKLGKSKERNNLFKEARLKYKFSDYAFQKIAIEIKNRCDIKIHLDTHVCQKIGTRVFNALNEYLLQKRGKPRFKRKGWLSSIEGKDNKAGIKFRKSFIVWKGLKLKIIFDKKDKYKVQAHSLSCKIKYVRLITRVIKGKLKVFAQLILEGKPLIKEKNKIKKETVGLDLGPSSIAIVGKKKACLDEFVKELKPLFKEIKLLQRKLDRSRRLNNPQNYDEKKRIIKKSKKLIWKKSNKYKKCANKIYELHRKMKCMRKRLHGKLANKILKNFGKYIKLEKLSYKSFQKNFGRSINYRAPSMFVEILRRKAENAGGYLYEFSTLKTALSQICLCGTRKKKKLSQRWHKCECGIKAQRDLFSAYLAKYVENNTFNISHARKSWAGIHPFLKQAMLEVAQIAKGRVVPSSFGLFQKSNLLVEDKSKLNEIKDVVGKKSRELLSV